MPRVSEYAGGTEKVSLRLPAELTAYCRELGPTLAAAVIECIEYKRAGSSDAPFRESLVDASPAFSDSARTRGLEKLAERESAPVHYPAVRMTLTPEGVKTFHDGVLQPEKQFKLPPIYQGGEDVTPRFKQEKGKKTGSVRADSQVPEFDDTGGAQEGGEEV